MKKGPDAAYKETRKELSLLVILTVFLDRQLQAI